MSETTLNAKYGIVQMSFPINWNILGPFSSTICPNEINILKLEQLNHQMTNCIYKGDLIGYKKGS